MKKEYMMPTMRVVELRQRATLLNSSPGSQSSVPLLNDEINDETLVF